MNIVISGGLGYLAQALTEQLISVGHHIIALDIVPESEFTNNTKIKSKMDYYQCDITDEQSVQAVFAAIKNQNIKIHCVISNAAIAEFSEVDDCSTVRFQQILNTNVVGTFNLFKAAQAELIRNNGYFLTIGSLAGSAATPGLSMYASSKAAVEALTDVLRNEMALQSVRIGCAYFSFIQSPMMNQFNQNERFQYLLKMMPWPLNQMLSVDKAVAALVDGIHCKKIRIYTPKWIGFLLAFRWFLSKNPSIYIPILKKWRNK